MRKTTLLAILALAAPAASRANGYDVPNVNPRDLSMAGSLVAAQQGAAATYQNPAALSKLDGLELTVAGSLLDIGTRWKAPASSDLAGSTARTRFRPAPPVSLFAAYGTKLADRGAGIGFGMNIPAGGNVFWRDDWAGRGRIITVDRKLYGFYLTSGYEIVPRFVRLGGGVNYIYAREYLKQGIQPDPSAYGELDASGGGLGYDLSAEITPLPSVPLTIGVDYKHKVTMHLTGDAHFYVPDALLQPNPTDPSAAAPVDQGVKHTLTYPNVLAVGAAYRPTEPLLVTFGYTFNRYVVYDQDVFQGDRGTTIAVPRHYGNGYTFRVGGEYRVSPRMDLRAGVLRDRSGFDESRYSPTLPDSDSWAGALGAGWRLREGLAVNAAVFYVWFDRVRQTSDVELQGIYDTRAWIASLGLDWRTDLAGGAR